MADGDSNSIVGGLMGVSDPDFLINIGAGLMAGAKYGSNAGEGILQGLQSYRQQKLAQQQYGMNRLQMGMLSARLPVAQQFYSQLGGLMGAPAPTSQAAVGSQAPGASAASPTSAASPPMPTSSTAPQGSPMATPTTADVARQTAPPSSSGGLMGTDPYRLLQMGTAGALAGVPEASALTDFAKTRLQYDPAIATQMAAAKDAVSVDQQMIQQALANGNRPLAEAIYNGKLQEDLGLLKVSSMGGIQTRINPASGVISTLNPSSGIQTTGNQASLMPGMAPALQQKATAEAVGGAAGRLVQKIDPVTHQPYWVSEASLLPGGGSGYSPQPQRPASPAPGASPSAAPLPQPAPQRPTISPAPGAAPSSAPAPQQPQSGGGGALAGLSPGQKGFLEERGKESAQYVTQLQAAADGATNTNYSLDQMLASARNAQLGPGAPARAFIENGVAALGQQFGIAPPKELANYEQLDKYANQVAFAATRQMGSREAAQIVHLQMVSNPNKQLVPEAFSGLVQSMKAMNNYIIAKNTAIQAQSGADNDSALQAASVWTQRIDPRVWDLSLGPELATKFASSIGVAKIATAIPAMAHDDGIAVIRNMPASMRPAVLARLPVQVKQEILSGMQQPTGTSGSF